MKKKILLTAIIIGIIINIILGIVIIKYNVDKKEDQKNLNEAKRVTNEIYKTIQEDLSKLTSYDRNLHYIIYNHFVTYKCENNICTLEDYDKILEKDPELKYKEKFEFDGNVQNAQITISNKGEKIVVSDVQYKNFICNYIEENIQCYKENEDVTGTLVGKVQVGDYIFYDPTKGVTDDSLLTYTSKVGELKIKNENEYIINESGHFIQKENSKYTDPSSYVADENYKYNGAYKLIDSNGEFTTEGYNVESDISGNGWNDQTFTADSSSYLWRVIDDGSKTGTIRIVKEIKKERESYEKFKIYFVGLRGYKNLETELDNASKIYGYGLGATKAVSITAEDINAITGYDPTKNSNYNKKVEVGRRIRKEWNNTAYEYILTDYFEIETGIYEMLSGSYFTKTKNIAINSDRAKFGIEIPGQYLNHYYLYRIADNGEEEYNRIDILYRPVVSLKKNVNYKSGDGSEKSPWLFQ